MIVIVDNGDRWETVLYFVEAPSAEVVEEVLVGYRIRHQANERARVVGTTERIDWKGESQSRAFEEFREQCQTSWL